MARALFECMKIIFFLIMSGCVFAGEIKSIKLNYKAGGSDDYAIQIQAQFKKLLDSDPDLAQKFHKFEAPPAEDARGRYSGESTIQVLTVSESEHVDFRESGGAKKFEKTIALYYRFDEGMHRGRESRSGFFALFVVNGVLSYRHRNGDDFELADAKVVANFKGFSRTLVGQEPK